MCTDDGNSGAGATSLRRAKKREKETLCCAERRRERARERPGKHKSSVVGKQLSKGIEMAEKAVKRKLRKGARLCGENESWD